MEIEILKEDHDEALLELSRVKQQLKNVLEEHNHAILQLKKSEEKFKTVADYTYDWEYWLRACLKISHSMGLISES